MNMLCIYILYIERDIIIMYVVWSQYSVVEF